MIKTKNLNMPVYAKLPHSARRGRSSADHNRTSACHAGSRGGEPQQSRNFGGGKLWAAGFAACDPVGRVRLRSRSIFAALIFRSADTRATYGARRGKFTG